MQDKFEFGPDVVTIEEAVFQALGAASSCWESMEGAGVFDDVRATEIGKALLAKVTELTPQPVGHHPADFGDEVRYERLTHDLQGYDADHDDSEGLGHLINEAVSILTRPALPGKVPNPRRELVKAASVLWAAADLIERRGK